MDVPARGATPAADPLAELARLVGQDDPFRGMFRPGAAQARAPAPEPAGGRDERGSRYPRDASHQPVTAPQPGIADPEDPHGSEAHGWHDDYGEAGDGEHGHQQHYAEDAAYAEAHGHHDAGYDEHYYEAEQAEYYDEAGLADGQLAVDAAAAATLPDMWARQGDERGAAAEVDHAAAPTGFDPDRRSSARRPLAVLAAVLVLTGGGLAASFLVKGPSTPGAAVAGSGRTAPTIMAATGPTKLKVDDPGATAPEDQDAALLNKGTVSTGPVKIVSSQEQPADLGQLPKTSDLADGARPLPPPSPSPFPEPKKVKTFVVHPDGTMLSADGIPSPAGAVPDATPRAANRGATTPNAATTPKTAAAPDAIAALATPADADAVGATPSKPARQPPSPGVRVASAKPNDTAEAPAAAGGSFGVQLASSPVEADANAAFAKLKKKYPAQLGSLTASVHKAETGDKPVYRVRVGSMSQEEAKALCTQLQGAGGSCFVVHN
ncbi:SPOR domain-containing protein [Lichenibacterium dinghuense]|uniref:SPOR domain-containing protein n=1 Tax=Lichenibacterium dinghuense TaxID=2895977 RepID=UPI001F28F858|nr:SPOR domain-containing protein [Lichenibacterium sp. 6Y81]